MKPTKRNKKNIILAISLAILVLSAIGIIAFLVRLSTTPAAIASRTLEEAKTDLQTVQDELVSSVPSDVITTTYPSPATSMVLFDCGYKDTYYWPGGPQLKINPTTDSQSILKNIYDTWLKKPDWTVTWITDNKHDGVYTLDLLRNDGIHVAIANLDNNTTLDFSGFSACFTLRDYDPNKAY